MKYKMLGAIAAVVLLAGCNSEDGSGGGLSFDVTGHWQVSADLDGIDENLLLNVVVDTEGRFAGISTPVASNKYRLALANMEKGAVGLNEAGKVVGTGKICRDEGDSCGIVSFQWDIDDDSTLTGTVAVPNVIMSSDNNDDGSTLIAVKVVRLIELSKAVDDVISQPSTWRSPIFTSVINLNTLGLASFAHSNGDYWIATFERDADNIYRFEGAGAINRDQFPVTISGLGYLGIDGQLKLGGILVIPGVDELAVGDSYKNIQ